MIRLLRALVAILMTLGAIVGALVALVQAGPMSAMVTLTGGLVVAALVMPDVD